MVHRSEILHSSHFQTYYQQVLPSAALAPFVKAYWRLESYQPLPMGVAEHYLPSLEARLVLPFGNSCYYQLPGHKPQAIEGPHLVLPQAQPLACLHPASQGILGISLTPAGLATFVQGVPSAGAILPLPDWLTSQSELARLGLFELQHRFLAQTFETLFWPTPHTTLLTGALAQLEQGAAISEVASELGLSARSLQRLFVQTLGHSPRTCLRVMRLRRTLKMYWQTPERRIWDSEYCDYSHFYKEFKALMGQSPSAYLQQFPAPSLPV